MIFEPWMFGRGVDVEVDGNDWSCLVFFVVFFLLGVVVEYSLLICSHNPMQKNLFSVIFESAVRKRKIAFQRLSVSVHKTSNFFWIPMALNHTETACSVTPNDSVSSSCIWLWSSSSNASNSLSSNIFGCPEQGLQRWNLHPWTSKSFPTWFIS